MFKKPSILLALVVIGSALLRGMMEDIIDTPGGLLAIRQIANFSLNEPKVGQLFGRKQGLHLVKILSIV